MVPVTSYRLGGRRIVASSNREECRVSLRLDRPGDGALAVERRMKPAAIGRPMMAPGGWMARVSGTESDGELYKLAVAGDRAAVEALVARHQGDLLISIRSKTNVPAAAEDAVAEAWLRFFRHLREASARPERALTKPESVRFWLYRTAFNALNDHFRSSSRQADLAERATVEARAQGRTSYQPDELAGLEGEERRSTLRDAFARLSEGCRELLALLATDPPLSYADVAELIGRPVGSIGPTRQRCLASLRQEMGAV